MHTLLLCTVLAERRERGREREREREGEREGERDCNEILIKHITSLLGIALLH